MSLSIGLDRDVIDAFSMLCVRGNRAKDKLFSSARDGRMDGNEKVLKIFSEISRRNFADCYHRYIAGMEIKWSGTSNPRNSNKTLNIPSSDEARILAKSQLTQPRINCKCIGTVSPSSLPDGISASSKK